MHGHALGERRLEPVVDHDHAVDLATGVELSHAMRDRLSVPVGRLVGETRELRGQLEAPEAQRPHSLSTDPDPANLLALAAKLAFQGECTAEDLGVERAGQAAVAGERHDRDGVLLVVPLQQRQTSYRRGRTSRTGHQLEHAVRIRPHGLDPHLRPTELGRSDELHRARDLARVADRADPTPDVLNRGH